MTIGLRFSTNGTMIEIADSGKTPGRFDEKDTIQVDDGHDYRGNKRRQV